MAGDWLKWCKGFARKPEVLAMADALERSRADVATAFMEVCEWLDTEGKPDDPDDVDSDITLKILSRDSRYKRHALLRTLDDVARIEGMASALENVGWVEFTDTSIVFKRAARHNTETAKLRALAANRQRRKREKDKQTKRHVTSVTREEKRRDIELPTVVPPVVPNGEPAESAKSSPAAEAKPGTIEELQAAWNATPGVRRCIALNESRRKAFRARSRDPNFQAHWRAALEKFPLRLFASDPEGWQPDIEWFLGAKTITGILEGKYDWSKTDGTTGANRSGQGRRSGGNLGTRGRVRDRDYSHLDGPGDNASGATCPGKGGAGTLFPGG